MSSHLTSTIFFICLISSQFFHKIISNSFTEKPLGQQTVLDLFHLDISRVYFGDINVICLTCIAKESIYPFPFNDQIALILSLFIIMNGIYLCILIIATNIIRYIYIYHAHCINDTKYTDKGILIITRFIIGTFYATIFALLIYYKSVNP